MLIGFLPPRKRALRTPIYSTGAQPGSHVQTFFFNSQSALSAIDHSFLLEVETPPRIGLVASGLTNIITSSMSRRGGIASIFRKLWHEAGVGCCDVIKRCEGNTGWESYACMETDSCRRADPSRGHRWKAREPMAHHTQMRSVITDVLTRSMRFQQVLMSVLLSLVS